MIRFRTQNGDEEVRSDVEPGYALPSPHNCVVYENDICKVTLIDRVDKKREVLHIYYKVVDVCGLMFEELWRDWKLDEWFNVTREHNAERAGTRIRVESLPRTMDCKLSVIGNVKTNPELF